MPYIRKRRKLPEALGPDAVPRVAGGPSPASWPIEVPIYLLVFFCPMALGTAHLWSAAVMLGLALFSFFMLTVRRRRKHMDIKLFPMGLALVAAAGFTLLQLVPLPQAVAGLLNPGLAEVCSYVCQGTGLWGEGAFHPLSLDPPGTSHELVMFLAYALGFLVVVNYFNARHRARRLMKMVAWSGFLVALIGFFSKLFVAQAIFGIHPVRPGTFFFSTFVNPNHLAGFLCLCSPVALGVGLSARERQDRALYGFMGVITGVAVFMSLSRGGMVALSLGIIFLIFFSATRRSRRIRRVALVQAAAAGVLVLAGYLAYDTIIKELRTLGDAKAIREDTKIRSWAATFPMMADHPVTGIGRGAYASVYPRYKTVEHTATFTHAENQVLQVLVEWGPVFGLFFLGAFALTFFLGLARARQSYSMGGCLAGIFAVSAHNLVDFNLEVGGVAMPFVLVLAIAVASPFSHAGGPRDFETKLRIPRWAGIGLAAAALVLAAVCIPYAHAHSLASDTEALLALDDPAPAAPCSDTPLGRAACDLMRRHPADYLAPLKVGKAFLGARPPQVERAGHWLARALYLNPTSSLTHRLAGRALFLAGRREQAMTEYRLAARWDPGVLTGTVVEVLRLSGDPQASLKATPDNPQALLKVARILRNLGEDTTAAQAARRALELDSTLGPAIDLLGELALEAERYDEALGLARQAIDVDPLNDRAYYLQGRVRSRMGDPVAAERAWLEGLDQVPDSTLLAYRLGELYLRDGRFAEAERIASRLQSFASPDDASQARLNLLLGRVAEAKGRLFEARKAYRMAATLVPGMLHYQHQVARMEERMGNHREAARIYLQLEQQRYKPALMRKKREQAEQAAASEHDEAMWKQWVEEEP